MTDRLAGRGRITTDMSGPNIVKRVQDFAAAVNDGSWLNEKFPEKDWHQHRRTDGRTDWCDGTPSDCASKERL